MILRILLISILIFFFVRFLYRLYRGYRVWKNLLNPMKQQAKSPEKMVKCTHCHLYIPEADAFIEKGRPFCCKEHAKQ